VQGVDPESGHASWLESFPWTRLEGVEVPRERKPMVDLARLRAEDPPGVRRLLGDGSYGGVYSRSDDDWRRVWQTGVEEVREVLEHGWR
jgi:creatinine amidohydrolase